MSKVQIELYEKYLSKLSSTVGDFAGMTLRGSRIFMDYQNLMKIWTHPWVLKMDEVRQENKVFGAIYYAREQLLLSARLSVRLSHGWISQKRSKLRSPNLHRRLPGRL